MRINGWWNKTKQNKTKKMQVITGLRPLFANLKTLKGISTYSSFLGSQIKVGNMLLSPMTSILVYDTTKRIDLIIHDVHDVSEPHLPFSITLYYFAFPLLLLFYWKEINMPDAFKMCLTLSNFRLLGRVRYIY